VEVGEYNVRQHTSAYVSIRQHTSAYVSIRQPGISTLRRRISKVEVGEYNEMRACPSEAPNFSPSRPPIVFIRQHTSHTSAYVSIRQRTSAELLAVATACFILADVSIRQHTSISTRQHTSAHVSIPILYLRINCPRECGSTVASAAGLVHSNLCIQGMSAASKACQQLVKHVRSVTSYSNQRYGGVCR
jgi:hypothetical protein